MAHRQDRHDPARDAQQAGQDEGRR